MPKAIAKFATILLLSFANLSLWTVESLASVTESDQNAARTAPILEIPSAEEFHLPVYDFLEQLQVDPDVRPTADLITFSKFADGFSPVRITSPFSNDGDSWFRFRLHNPREETINAVLMSRFWFASIKIVHSHPSLGHPFSSEIGYRSGVNASKAPFFPAEQLSLPPGESMIYVAIDSNKHPSNIDFQLVSEQSFYTLNHRYIVTAVAFLVLVTSLIAFNAIVMVIMRSMTLVYFLVCASGLNLLQIWLSGILNMTPLYNGAASIQIWLWAIALTVSGGSMFTLKFFNMTRKSHPGLYYGHYLNSALIFGEAIFSSYFWKQSLQVVAISVTGLLLMMAIVIAKSYVIDRRRTLFFNLCVFPVLLSAMLELKYYFQVGHAQSYFVYFSLSSVVSLALMSIFAIADLLRSEKRTRVMTASLHSMLPPLQVQKILEDGLSLDLSPQERYISIMFVDIVGYSIAARSRAQTETFMYLKDTLSFIGQIVHQFGGVIDKSLGDGCLCFFGYNLAGNESAGHERSAVNCALEIQRRMVDKINALGALDKDIYPLRIGINSAVICIGNMGDENRFDFTLHGDGVNMAKRFESACEPFKVTIGKSTYEALDEKTRNSERYYQRLVPIKNAVALVEAYEVNPFDKDSVALEQARARYWKSIGVQRTDHRYVPRSSTMLVKSDYGEMVLQNFSVNGFCIKSRVFIGKGAELTLDLTEHIQDPSMAFLGIINVQVRWGVPTNDDHFILGTMTSGLSDQHREIVFDYLVKAAERDLALSA